MMVLLFTWLCSHQESNLDRRNRNPAFYPLNYESVDTMLAYCLHSVTYLLANLKKWLEAKKFK